MHQFLIKHIRIVVAHVAQDKRNVGTRKTIILRNQFGMDAREVNK